MAGEGQEVADNQTSTDSDIGLDPNAIKVKHKLQVSRARKNYRMMRTYSQPYWYYYRAQIARDQKMINMKRNEFEEVCLTGKRVGSDFNRRKEAEKVAQIKQLFNDYLKVKNKLAEARELMATRKLQQQRADSALISAKASPKQNVFGRFKNIDEALAWIPKYQERLNVANGMKNKVISRACELRRLVSSMLSERIIYTESVVKSLNHLAKGNKYMLDVLEQALVSFKRREDALMNLQKTTEKRQANRDEAQRTLNYLKLRLERELEKAMFFTQKGQTRIITGLLSQDNFSPAALEAHEKELREQIEDGFKYFLTVSGFFYTTNLNAQQIAQTYTECIDQNFHHLSFLIDEGVQAEKNHFLANNLKSNIMLKKRNLVKTMKDYRNSLAELSDDATYWETEHLKYANRVEYLANLKNFYFDIIGEIFFKTDLAYILNLYPNWRCLDVLSHALIRIETIVKKAIAIHRKQHKELYDDPYHYNKYGQYVIVLPKDPRKRSKALTIIMNRRAVKDSNLIPEDTPCPLCIEEQRIMTYRQMEDKLRSPLYFTIELTNSWKSARLADLAHGIQKCGQPRARELQANDVLNF